MTVNIGDANISGVRLAEQDDDPSTPASGFGQLFAKADGLYFIGDDGVVEGPLALDTGWVDYSEISTIVGWSSFTTKAIFYKKVGNIIFVAVSLSGTSNSTSASFTLPEDTSSQMVVTVTSYVQDNGVVQTTPGRVQIGTESSDVILGKDMSGAAWAASETKTIRAQFFYSVV